MIIEETPFIYASQAGLWRSCAGATLDWLAARARLVGKVLAFPVNKNRNPTLRHIRDCIPSKVPFAVRFENLYCSVKSGVK